jgi:hypothetical protein
VLLLVDGNYGFEMETFEFLNLLQVHGFPKVMGVLTHLDEFTDAKKLRQVKKQLKAREWGSAQHTLPIVHIRLTCTPTAPLLDGDLQRRQALLHLRHGASAYSPFWVSTLG